MRIKTIAFSIAATITLSMLAGCGDTSTVKVRGDIDWSILKKSVAYASIVRNSWQAPQNIELPKVNINLTQSLPPLETVDQLASGQGTMKEMVAASDKIELLKDKVTKLMTDSLEGWDMDRTATRAENIANIMHIKQPFTEILIQPDPVLPSGLSRTIIEGTTARIIIPAGIAQKDFDTAYINALVTWELKNKKPDFSRLEQFCIANGAFLPATEQFASDLAFAMGTWIEGTVEPDYRTYLLKSSLDFGHVFAPQVSQWAGNFFHFLGNVTLSDVIESAVKDCENPLYQKLYSSLKNHGHLPLKLEDSPEGVKITGFENDKTENTGLLVGDIVTEFDKIPVKSTWSISSILFDKNPGETLTINILRPEQKGSQKSYVKLDKIDGKLKLIYKIELE